MTSTVLGNVGQRVPADPGHSGNPRRGGVQMTLAGSIRAIRRRINRGGFLTLEDHSGRLEVSLFDQTWNQYAELLTKDEIIVVEGRVSADDFSGGYKMNADRIQTLAQAKAAHARGVLLSLRGPVDGVCRQLQGAFAPYRNPNGRPVYVDYANARARARLELGGDWRVEACEELVAALADLPAVSEARLVY